MPFIILKSAKNSEVQIEMQNINNNNNNNNNNKNFYYYNNNNSNNNQNVNMLQQQQLHQQQQQQIRVSNWVQQQPQQQQQLQHCMQQQQQQPHQQVQFQNYTPAQQQIPTANATATVAGTAAVAVGTTISPLPSMNFYPNHTNSHHQLQLLQHQQQHVTCMPQQQTPHTQSRLYTQQQNLKLLQQTQHHNHQQQQQQQQLQQLQHPQQVLTPAPSPHHTANNSFVRQQQQQQQQQQQHHMSPSQPHLTPQQQQRLQHLLQTQAQAQAQAQHQTQQQQQQQHSQTQQQQSRLVSMECMQTGVPTLTTPTLTPTTLKSIEESFIQLTSEPINVPYQAGFIPPPLGSYSNSASTTTNTTTINNNDNSTLTTTVAGISPNTTTTLHNVYLGDISAGASLPDYGEHTNDTDSENSQGSWTGNHLNEENSMATTDTSSAADSFQNSLNGLGANALNNSNSSTTNEFTPVQLAALAVATAAKMSNAGNHNNNNTSLSATTTTATPTRRGGGRRPATNSNMTPEEEEKRRIRRERNKLAAARCRKRRVDQTNELTQEVERLEKKREDLHKEIESLKGMKNSLEFLLEEHRPTCHRVVAEDILSGNTFDGLLPSASSMANDNITGVDTSLATTARCISPLDLKPVLNDQLLAQIKAEPMDPALDSSSSLDQDGPPSKRLLLSDNNPMIPPPLPNVATLSASLAAASASLNTPIVTTAPVSFSSMYSNNPSLSSPLAKPNSKQRPNSLPTIPRNLTQNLGLNINDNKPPTDINGVAIQTPSTGMFNFDSLMDGGTGLTPVSNPLVPNCSSQNKHPLELVTPTSEPSKLVSL